MSEQSQTEQSRDAIAEIDSLMQTMALMQRAIVKLQADAARAHQRLDALKVIVTADIVE